MRRPLGSWMTVLGVAAAAAVLAVHVHAAFAGQQVDEDTPYEWHGEALFVTRGSEGWCVLEYADGRRQALSIDRTKARHERTFLEDLDVFRLRGAAVPAEDGARGRLDCRGLGGVDVITGWPTRLYGIATSGFPVVFVAIPLIVGGRLVRRALRPA